MRTRILLAAVAAALVATPTVAQVSPAAKPVTVPFELLPSRHMAIQVKLNGTGPYRLIFDTGAPISLLNTRVAKKSGLTKKAGGGFSLFTMPNTLEVNTLEIAGLKAEKVSAVVMDHPTVQAISDAFEANGGPIEGIIGFPLFARYATTIDYQKKEMTFAANGYKPGDYLQDVMKSLTAATETANKPKVIAPAGLWGFDAKKADDDKPGVVVSAVSAGGPAAKAGVKVGDRLLTVDGRWTDSPGDLAVAAAGVKPGTGAAVVLSRDGKGMSLTITPANGL